MIARLRRWWWRRRHDPYDWWQLDPELRLPRAAHLLHVESHPRRWR